MGSSGSRLSGSAVETAQGSRPLRKSPQNFLAPLLSSMGCGASSSWRMDSFTQERMNTSRDHLARQISLEKSAAHEGQPSVLRLQSLRDADNRDISDEQSIIDLSEVSLQSLCGSVESVDPTLFNGCNSSVVDDANTSLSGQRHISLIKTDVLAANLSSSHRVFGTQNSNDDCFSISNDSYHEHASNHSTLFGQNITDCSVGDVSRVEVMPDCTFKQESSVGCSDVERMPSFIHDSSNLAMNTSLLQDTLSSELSTNLGVLQHDASSPAEAVDSTSISRPESSGREARRNNRRRLWDALTRVSSRRRSFSPFYMPPDEDGDSSRTLNDDWGSFDWNSHELSNQIAHESGAVSRRSSTMENRRWRARPQAQHNIDSMGGRFGHSRHCAFVRNPNGNCTCEAFVLTEESSTGASISRIVMLAEALFEVLDEIHRQSVTLSRSTSYSLVSFPAPEEVVNSFASRIHNKSDPSMSSLGQCAECYICLVEYEDGDRIRVLPCCHEFHMLCVDRWLKEAHRVCPLCRCNVCEESIKT